MPFIKRNPFGHILFLKKLMSRIFGVISHSRYRKFNSLQIEGSDILRNLPDSNVLFISNHQTYFADVAAMFHVYNADLKDRDDSIKNVGYIWHPKLNVYFVAAGETMKSGLLPKLFAYDV
jgi:1-acyl-sn-glycerol-3-phosphate acyltransferase